MNRASVLAGGVVALTRFVVIVTIVLSGTTGGNAQPGTARIGPLSMTATAYCLTGETATGTQVKSGTVAADPNVLPMGTTIRVTGLLSPRPQTFTVADTGPAVKGNEIDVYISDCARARKFGRRPVRVHVLNVPKQ
jgi:3D (Asp-Asp-Asp) domain-containing protein